MATNTTYVYYKKNQEQLDNIKRIMNRYQKIGFKSLNQSDYQDLANYYLDEIFFSGLSLFDYSFNNYMPFPYGSSASLTRLLKTLESTDQAMYEAIITRDDTYKEQAIEIIKNIADNNLDIIDYYSMTKLNPLFFNENFASYKRYNAIGDLYRALLTDTTTLEKEIKVTYIAKGGVVSPELKEQVFKELERMNIPQTTGTYRALVRRKVNEK